MSRLSQWGGLIDPLFVILELLRCCPAASETAGVIKCIGLRYPGVYSLRGKSFHCFGVGWIFNCLVNGLLICCGIVFLFGYYFMGLRRIDFWGSTSAGQMGCVISELWCWLGIWKRVNVWTSNWPFSNWGCQMEVLNS